MVCLTTPKVFSLLFHSIQYDMNVNIYILHFICNYCNKIECELILLSDSKSSDLPIKLIKIASKPLSRFFCIIINHSFQTGTFPNKLKFAIVTPIHKRNCHLTLGNHRPISLLPVFSKIIEKLMYVRLMKFLMKENILFDHQYGFPKKQNYFTCNS